MTRWGLVATIVFKTLVVCLHEVWNLSYEDWQLRYVEDTVWGSGHNLQAKVMEAHVLRAAHPWRR